MDNAAKALLIAGGILIGTLIVSFAMYLYNTFQDAYYENTRTIDANLKNAFNSKITMYGNDVVITGTQAWNILSYVEDAQIDEYTIAKDITSDGNLNTTNYKSVLFFTDALSSTYNFHYDYGADGVISKVTINNT